MLTPVPISILLSERETSNQRLHSEPSLGRYIFQDSVINKVRRRATLAVPTMQLFFYLQVQHEKSDTLILIFHLCLV